MFMKKRTGVYKTDNGRSVTIDKLASKIIEVNESEYNIVYSDSMKEYAELTLQGSDKTWKETGRRSAISIDDGLEGMQNGH